MGTAKGKYSPPVDRCRVRWAPRVNFYRVETITPEGRGAYWRFPGAWRLADGLTPPVARPVPPAATRRSEIMASLVEIAEGAGSLDAIANGFSGITTPLLFPDYRRESKLFDGWDAAEALAAVVSGDLLMARWWADGDPYRRVLVEVAAMILAAVAVAAEAAEHQPPPPSLFPADKRWQAAEHEPPALGHDWPPGPPPRRTLDVRALLAAPRPGPRAGVLAAAA